MMINELCTELNNFFSAEDDQSYGKFSISDGELINAPATLKLKDFYFIQGSRFNDGVHEYGNTASELRDETFTGTIGIMSIPPAVFELCRDIEKYTAEQQEASPYLSESFGGYSYTKAQAKNGTPATWREVFSSRLRRWRKIRR